MEKNPENPYEVTTVVSGTADNSIVLESFP